MASRCRLIDEFQGKTLLYMDMGELWVVNCHQDEYTIYSVRTGASFKANGLCMGRWDSKDGIHKVISDGYTPQYADAGSGVDLIGSLFGGLPVSYREQIQKLNLAEDKLAMCQFLSAIPAKVLESYPYQYLAIIFYSRHRSTITNQLKQKDWVIETSDLARALEVSRLTQGQRSLIRALVFSYPWTRTLDELKYVMDHWDRLGKKFHHAKSVHYNDLELMAVRLRETPALVEAKWYNAGFQSSGGTVAGMLDAVLEETWHYVCATEGELDFDPYIVDYIQGAPHLKRLAKQADCYFETNARTHVSEKYADTFVFPKPDCFDDRGHPKFRLIRTAGELRTYAGELKNCSASYVSDIAEGKYLLFYYQHDGLEGIPSERGMLQVCIRSLKHILKSEKVPDWDQCRLQRVVRQFRGFRNREMSAHAWTLLENFIENWVRNEWESRHGDLKRF